jgi:hypothetical protein
MLLLRDKQRKAEVYHSNSQQDCSFQLTEGIIAKMHVIINAIYLINGFILKY